MARCDKGPTFWSGYYQAQTSANSCYRTGMWYGRTRQCLPLLVFSSLTAASLAGLLLLPAVPQDQSYHLFADCRAVAGIPNFWNVVSNIPFIAIGAAGLWRFRDDPATVILFLGFFLTGIGSSYYHWHPNDATLFWDRLPMTLSFAAILSLGVAERLCHGNSIEHALEPRLAKRHAAATASCHSAVASARKIRSVDREMRWR